MGKTIRSFNATEEINDLINESKLPKGKMSDWINDKIKKGILYEQSGDKPKIPAKSKGTIIGTMID